MSAGPMTRRSLLAATAGALAGGIVRPGGALAGARLHLVDVSGGAGASSRAAGPLPLASTAALPTVAQARAAGPGQPPIIARRAWAQGMAPPRVAPGYGAVRLAFVHHTENPNGYSPGEVSAMLRAIYAYHRFARGWNDIGYNFVVDLYGRIWEARAGGVDEPVVGAQAGGYNLLSTGVAVLGSFAGTPISPAARDALQRLPATTPAPLPTPPPAPVPAPGVTPPAAPQARLLAGTLALLDGTPLAGARIAVQARSVSARGQVVGERTIAEAATDAQGRWSLPVSVAPRRGTGVSLRALSAGSGSSGACVSDPLRVAGQLSLTPPPAPAPTAPAAAPPAP